MARRDVAERLRAAATSRSRRRWAAAGAALVVVASLAALLLGIRSDRSDAGRLKRGEPVALASSAAAAPLTLDPAAALASVNATRAEASAQPLSASSCLDAAAAATAAAFAKGATPDRLASAVGCDRPTGPDTVRWGWVSGADPSGQAQLQAAFARGASGASALAAADATQLGLSLDRRTDAEGRVTGFVLVWALSS